MNKCVFLDRDGVLNLDHGDYTWQLEDFVVMPGVAEALEKLKASGYLLVVITNQAGIAKGLYGHEDVRACHQKLQEETGHLIDAFYYSPYHPSASESLGRKPGTLLFEKAIARFDIDIHQSWMVGDRTRDMEAGKKVGLKTIFIELFEAQPQWADFKAHSLKEATKFIV